MTTRCSGGGLRSRVIRIGLGLGLAWSAGEAGAQTPAGSENDPWEAFNRPVFAFNEGVDRFLLEPVARGYDFVVPGPVQTWIDNFFDNIRVPIDTVNSLLQGKPRDAGVAVGRFLVNSTIGFAGFFDPARSELGLEPVREDFGQTLGVWGVGNGPFLVIPLLGPSTPRDAVGMGVDSAAAVYPWFAPFAATASSRGVALVNSRSILLPQIEDSRKSSLDYYAFVRNAYLQYRQALVEDRKVGDGTKQGATDDDMYEILPGY